MAVLREAVEAPGGAQVVTLVLDRGRVGPAGWESEDNAGDRLVSPAATAAGDGARLVAALPPGPGVARIARAGCGAVDVPYTVGPVPLVTLPYPACDARDAPSLPTGTRLDAEELPWSDLVVLRELDLFGAVPLPAPGEEDGPARWLDLTDARALCAWRGGRLPTLAEWASARTGSTGVPVSNATRDALGEGPVGATARALAGVSPRRGAYGHRDVDGNVAEWLADGRIAGGSWVTPAGELDQPRVVPPVARTDTIGVRCAYDQ
jgi:hypothetical protein